MLLLSERTKRMKIGGPRRTHLPSLCAGALVIICLLAVLVAPVAAAAPKPNSWIELGNGSDGNFLWSIKAKLREGSTGEGPLGAQRPCLLVAASWQTGQLEYHRSKYRQCAPASPLPRSGPPLVAAAMQPSTDTPSQMSAIGMIFAPAADRVRVTFAGGAVEILELHRLSPGQALAAGLRHLRYAAFAIHGTWCAERLVSLDRQRRVLWDSGVDDYRCGRQAPGHLAGRYRLLARQAQGWWLSAPQHLRLAAIAPTRR